MVAIRQAVRRSARVRYGLLGAAAVLAAAQFASAVTFTWIQTGAGPYSWSTQGNWTGGILPTAAGDTATIHTTLTAAEAITLDGTVTLGTLNLGDAGDAFAYTISAGSSGSFVFNNLNAGAQINELSTSFGDTISAPISVTDTAGLTISNASAHLLTLSGNVTTSSGVTVSTTNTGGVTVSGSFTSTSGNAITINSTSTGVATFSGPIAFNNSSGTTINNASSNQLTLTGAIADGGFGITINSTGMGAVSFQSNSNSITGPIYILSGKLNSISNAGVTTDPYGTGTIYLGNTSGSANATLINNSQYEHDGNPIVVQAGNTGTATIQYSGNALNSTAFTGNITIDNNLSINNAFSNQITLTSITQDPSVTTAVTLSDTSTNTGGINIGTVAVGSGGLKIDNVSTGPNQINFTGNISVGGDITINPTGTRTVSFQNGSNSITSNIYVLGGTLTSVSTLVANTTPFGSGTIYLGNTSGSANATLINPSQNDSITNPITVQAGTTGTLTIEYTNGGSGTAFKTGLITLNNNLTFLNDSGGGAAEVIASPISVGSAAVTLTVSGTNTAGETLSGGMTLGAGGLTIANSTTRLMTLSGNITGPGALTDSPTNVTPATLVLSGSANTFSGLNINGGTLQAGNANSGVLGSGNVSFGTTTAETLNLNAFSSTVGLLAGGSSSFGVITNNSSTAGTSTLTLAGTGSQTFAGTIQNGTNVIAAGSVAQVALTLNSGAQTLTGNNTYTGVTTINGGTLITGSTNALGFGGLVRSTIARPGIANINAGGALDMSGQTLTEAINLNGATLTNSGTAATLNSGVNGFYFPAAPPSFSGDAAITFSGGGGSGAAATALLGVKAATFTISGGSGYTAAPTVMITNGGGSGATATATITAGVVTSITITNPGTGFTSAPTITFSAPTSGTTATGTGNDIFTLVSLQETATGSGYASTPTTTLAGTTGTLGLIASMGSITLLGTSNSIGGAGNITVNGIIYDSTSGSGGFTKTGADTVTLTAANSYSGTTNITTGTLSVSSTGSINFTSGVVLNGGTFNYNSATAYTQPLAFGTGGTVSGAGTISASGGLTAGTNAIVSPGNGLASPGSQSYTTGLTLNTGSTYQWNNNEGNTAGVVGANFSSVVNGGSTIAINGGTLALDFNSTTDFVSGLWSSSHTWDIISGGGVTGSFTSITISGSSLSLTNAPNTLSQGTFSDAVTGGDLILTWTPSVIIGGVPPGSGTWKNGTADGKWTTNTSANNNWAVGIPNGIDQVATFDDTAIGGAGTVDLNGDKTVGGLILNTASAGYTLGLPATTNTLTLQTSTGNASIGVGGGAAHTINALVNLASNTNVSFTGSGARLNLVGAVSGTGSLNLSGTGTLILSSAAGNTYTGTNVSGGTLLVSNTSGSATGSSNVVVTGGTLGGHGIISGTVNASSGTQTIFPSATLSSTSTGTLTMGGLTTGSGTTLQFNLVTPGNALNSTVSNSDMIAVTGANGLVLNGGAVNLTNHATGAASLGFYKVISYSGTIGGTGLSSLTLPASVANVEYTFDTTHDPGFVDIHRGFAGDVDDSGFVDINDLAILAAHWQQAGGWAQGNFLGDPVVDINDLAVLAANWQTGITSFGEAADSLSGTSESFQQAVASVVFGGASSVPEPTSLALLGLGAVGLLRRRRR